MSGELIISMTLFGADGAQVTTCLLKMGEQVQLSRVFAVFCRWAAVDPGAVSFFFNERAVDGDQTAAQQGLSRGVAMHARMADGAPPPACSPFSGTLLDVADAELSMMAGGMGICR